MCEAQRSAEAMMRRKKFSSNAIGPFLGLALTSLVASCGGGGLGCVPGAPCGGAEYYDQNVPAKVVTAQRFTAIGLGWRHSCMTDVTGGAWCWGSNEYGQLGAASTMRCLDNNVDCSWSPLKVEGVQVFSQLAASDDHTCGLTPEGQAWCWGRHDRGQLGDGRTAAGPQRPVAVAGGHRFVALVTSLGESVTCGLKDDGAVWCWGDGFFSGAAAGAGPSASLEPTRWTQAATVAWRSIGLGWAHACGLDAAGLAWCLGNNQYGQLGNGGSTSAAAPVAVAVGRVYQRLAVGYQHACALDSTGQAWCWGFGAAGDGSTSNEPRPTPVAVAGRHRFTQITAGHNLSCGLTADGTAWCWGDGGLGQLGNGASAQAYAPVAVAGGLKFTTMGVSANSTCGVTADGTAYCWGWNSVGAVGIPVMAH